MCNESFKLFPFFFIIIGNLYILPLTSHKDIVSNNRLTVILVIMSVSTFITGFATRVTQWVPLVEQELLELLEHLSSPRVFSGVPVTPGVENSTSPTSWATIFNCRATKFCHKKSLTD